jgi:hypothetical protein
MYNSSYFWLTFKPTKTSPKPHWIELSLEGIHFQTLGEYHLYHKHSFKRQENELNATALSLS